MPPDRRAIAGVDDSKRLSPAERVRLAAKIRERALGIGVGAASVREIDAINVYHATVLAMRRALRRLPVTPDHVLIDGKPIRTLGVPHQAVVAGDATCFSIACASIVAKVTRDRLMAALGRRYPGYGWERNAGYATPDHHARLAAGGLTPHHRRSFCRAPDWQLLLPLTQLEAVDGGADEPADEIAGPCGDDGLTLAVLHEDLSRGAPAGPPRPDGPDDEHVADSMRDRHDLPDGSHEDDRHG
jgi:ribonuclease HII